MALDFVAGCAGGVAGVVVGHPFDTVKVRLQCQDAQNKLYKGTLDCLKKIVLKESPMGLYAGVSSPLFGLGFINAIVFGVQGNVSRQFSDPNSLKTLFISGSVAGFAQTFICSPMELTKTIMQVQHDHANAPQYKSPFDCFIKLFKSSGFRGVFRGFGLTTLREVPSFGTYFVTYEQLMRMAPDASPSSIKGLSYLLLAGGLAGCASWFVTYPVDVMKSRFQADAASPSPIYKNVRDCIVQSKKTEGWRVFFTGLAPTLIRAFPTNAATLTVVTLILRFVKDEDEDEEQNL